MHAPDIPYIKPPGSYENFNDYILIIESTPLLPLYLSLHMLIGQEERLYFSLQ